MTPVNSESKPTPPVPQSRNDKAPRASDLPLTMTAEQLREEYLAELDTALAPLPHGTAIELRSAICAELIGRSLPDLRTRIADLGTPTSIVEAALAEEQWGLPGDSRVDGLVHQSSNVAHTPARTTDTRGFAIAALLTLGFGGIVVPFVGWFVGAALVMLSSLWSVREKTRTLLFTPVIMIIIFLGYALLRDVLIQPAAVTLGTEVQGTNPLLPANYDAYFSTLVLGVVLLAPCTAGWLLFKLRKRSIPLQISPKV